MTVTRQLTKSTLRSAESQKFIPDFLAKALSDFHNIWQKYYTESEQSKDAIFSYLT